VNHSLVVGNSVVATDEYSIDPEEFQDLGREPPCSGAASYVPTLANAVAAERAEGPVEHIEFA
jgi:hypothetical protein